jgi:hypothetical protein
VGGAKPPSRGPDDLIGWKMNILHSSVQLGRHLMVVTMKADAECSMGVSIEVSIDADNSKIVIALGCDLHSEQVFTHWHGHDS